MVLEKAVMACDMLNHLSFHLLTVTRNVEKAMTVANTEVSSCAAGLNDVRYAVMLSQTV